jgi:hypothetical protein
MSVFSRMVHHGLKVHLHLKHTLFSEMFVPRQENSVIVEHTQHMNGASTLGGLVAFSIADKYRLFQAASAFSEHERPSAIQALMHVPHYETRNNLIYVGKSKIIRTFAMTPF